MSNRPEMIDILSAGIRGASVRQNLIADNIANVHTPGFRRKAVEFEKALARAMDSGDGMKKPLDARVTMPIDPNAAADETGNNVDLETEVSELVKNSTSYKAYMRILNKVYKQMELAMTVQ